MPVVGSDIAFYQSSVSGSTGGAISGTAIVSGSSNNLWPDVSSAEATAGGSRVRKTFITNTHGTDALAPYSIWVSVQPTNTTEEIALGFDDPDDDDAGQVNMTDFGANDILELVSDGSDTRDAFIVGVDGSGNPASETVTLAGTTPVDSATTWSIVYGIHLSAPSASRTVTAKQGVAGTTRGTIGPNKVTCALWISAGSKSAGLLLETLDAGDSVGMWDRLTWSAATGSVDPDSSVISVEPL